MAAEKQKIGILTLYYKNYNLGGALQAYALQKAIAELDETDTCEQICLALPKDVPAGQENSTAAQLLSKCLRKVQRMVLRYRLKERIARYQSFLEAIPHSVAVYAHDDVQQSNALYDVFVVGSDQVWADWLPAPALQAYSLDFVETTKKRVAYAASFANTSLSDKQKKMLAHGIKCMDYISVREKTARNMVNELCERQACQVVDPVFLIPADAWAKLSFKERIPNEQYALCYFLGTNTKQRIKAKRIAHAKNLKVINIAGADPYHPCKLERRYSDRDNYKAGPADFVQLIAHASLVLTDSFHAVAFSVIFERDFLVFKRFSDNDEKSMNSRIENLLEDFGLTAQLVGEEGIDSTPADFSMVRSRLEEKRMESVQFLRKALL